MNVLKESYTLSGRILEPGSDDIEPYSTHVGFAGYVVRSSCMYVCMYVCMYGWMLAYRDDDNKIRCMISTDRQGGKKNPQRRSIHHYCPADGNFDDE